MTRVSRNPAQFDEQKLRWMNGRYMRELAPDDLTRRLEEFTGRAGLAGAAEIAQEKISTLADFWPLVGFLFDGPVDDPGAREKWLQGPGREALADAREALADVTPFEPAPIEEALQRVIERRQAKPRDVFQPIRVALVGQHGLAGHLRDDRPGRARRDARAPGRRARRLSARARPLHLERSTIRPGCR